MPHPALSRLGHRPWPLPDRRWWGRQVWRDLLFAHWPIPAATVLPFVPSGLEVQEWDGTSWVGIVPFRMSDVTLRGLPSVPGLSAFPELNLRLYVECAGQPGVWFLSLDAANRVAVALARRFFHLPYFYARMSCREEAGTIHYRSARYPLASGLEFEATYRGVGSPYESQPGTLEHWLTERYCLYASGPDGGLYRGDIHHHPWPLQKAEAHITRCDLTRPYFPLPGGEPALVHFARRIDVVVWSIARIGS